MNLRRLDTHYEIYAGPVFICNMTFDGMPARKLPEVIVSKARNAILGRCTVCGHLTCEHKGDRSD